MAPPSVVTTAQAPFAFQEDRDPGPWPAQRHQGYTWPRAPAAQAKAQAQALG